ncbi:MAG: hypothetical protein GX824_05205 [Clostridiales bacterium]|jgi:shikimate dehydrogenase|nr:hypothetical protein [Clostridiales bacterium]
MEYGLIGEKLNHSFSEPIHKLLGGYDYELKCLLPQELPSFFEKRDFKGLNITIPYKKTVIEYCKNLSPEAQRIGSVNTITVEADGSLTGHNTDYAGFLYMAGRAGISFEGKKVLILGTGGTSLTAAAAAQDSGAREIVTTSRKGEVNYENIYQHNDSNIIINTTPVGMYPKNGERLIDIKKFSNCSGIIDVIYNPLKTSLLLEAEMLRIPYTNGLPMLVAQAKYANDLFLGAQTSEDRIEPVLKQMLRSMMNITFVGMPGSGKTTVGRLTAQLLGRKFIDTDELIEQQTEMTIEEIFEALGEDNFRSIESGIVAQACRELGAVIATGGGSILNPKNTQAIRQNSFVVHLERELDSLDTVGRPLSAGQDSLGALWQQRHMIYQSICDYKPEDDIPIEIAQEVVRRFNENSCY